MPQQAAAVERWCEHRGLWHAMPSAVAGYALLQLLMAGKKRVLLPCTSCGFLHTDVGYLEIHVSWENLC